MKWFYNLPNKTRTLILAISWIPFFVLVIAIDFSNSILAIVALLSAIPPIFFSVLTFFAEQKAKKHGKQVHTSKSQKASQNSELDNEEIQLMLKASIIQSRLAAEEEKDQQAKRIAEYKKFIETYNALQMAEDKPENTISVDGWCGTDDSNESKE